METIAPCESLPWDTEFFGRRIARATVHRLSIQTVESILEWCKSHAIECVYFLADSDHAESVRLAEDYGFRLVDVRVTLQCNKDEQSRLSHDLFQTAHVHPVRQSDVPALQAIARTSHTDSRFYFDPCFPVESCEALYRTWIKRSCEGYADVVLVAELNDQPVGYVSCHLTSNEPRGRIGLVGVAAQARGQGVGQTLIRYATDWFVERGIKTISVVTQGRNTAAQRLYQRSGFLTQCVEFWYHKWLSGCTHEETRDHLQDSVQ